MAFYTEDQAYLREIGVRDSKALSDAKRRRLVPEICDISLCGALSWMEVEKIDSMGQKATWRGSVRAALQAVITVLRGMKIQDIERVVIDGSPDPGLRGRFDFVVKADVTIPAVSAASVVAKTVRNDRMICLHDKHPEYMWSSNMGYGTPEHEAAIRKYGLTAFHRRIKRR